MTTKQLAKAGRLARGPRGFILNDVRFCGRPARTVLRRTMRPDEVGIVLKRAGQPTRYFLADDCVVLAA
jgi:hypothetical protein